MMSRRIIVLCFWLWVGVAHAQPPGFVAYAWQEGDLALAYPPEWLEPASVSAGTNALLTLRADDTPDAPQIELVRAPGGAGDLYALLQTLMQTRIIPTGPTEVTLAGVNGVATSGVSSDRAVFGLGRAAVLLNGDLLVVTGYAPAEERDSFTQIFNTVADSIADGVNSVPRTGGGTYGVLWHITTVLDRTLAGPVGLAYASDNSLYTVDASIGIIQLDANTGDVLNIFPEADLSAPTDIAVDAAGLIYIADAACRCIYVYNSTGVLIRNLSGFAAGQPTSLSVLPSGRVYASDSAPDSAIRFYDGQTGRGLPPPVNLTAAPVLASDPQGRVLALSGTTIYTVQGSELSVLLQLPDLPPVSDFAVDANGSLILATVSQGILLIDAQGRQVGRVGRVVPDFPRPGELVSPTGIAVSEGAIYWIDSGAITAMSTRAPSNIVGTGALTLGVAAQGAISEFATTQSWTFTAAASDTISAVIVTDATLEVALRLLSPSGAEIAYSPTALNDVTLTEGGTYILLVEQLSGTGAYRLGVAATRRELVLEQVVEVSGELQDVFPLQRWYFTGQAGQILTITLRAQDDDLDPLLRLRDAAGTLLTENDDAADPALGRDAQISQFVLPADGDYVLEAVRFDGAGRYRLVVVTLNP